MHILWPSNQWSECPKLQGRNQLLALLTILVSSTELSLCQRQACFGYLASKSTQSYKVQPILHFFSNKNHFSYAWPPCKNSSLTWHTVDWCVQSNSLKISILSSFALTVCLSLRHFMLSFSSSFTTKGWRSKHYRTYKNLVDLVFSVSKTSYDTVLLFFFNRTLCLCFS